MNPVSTTTPATLPATGTWSIDPVHSAARFRVTHLGVATFRAGFHNPTGSLENGVLSGSVEYANIDLGLIPAFKEHLMSEDWFDAASHPTLSFRSTDLHSDGDGTVRGSGELTIKAITKPVQFSGTVTGPLEVTRPDGVTQQRLGLDLTATLDRRDFNITGTGGADWIVTLEVSLALAAD
jgi:polyisoprenoid-binding protein YceI